MVSYVLDASALLRYLDREEGATRVAQILKGQFSGNNRVMISAVNWGEVAGILEKRHGQAAVENALESENVNELKAANAALDQGTIPLADSLRGRLWRGAGERFVGPCIGNGGF